MLSCKFGVGVLLHRAVTEAPPLASWGPYYLYSAFLEAGGPNTALCRLQTLERG